MIDIIFGMVLIIFTLANAVAWIIRLTKTGWAWVWFGFLLALDIAIPWFVLTHVDRMSGAFLFWTIWAAAAIASAFVIFLKWKEARR